MNKAYHTSIIIIFFIALLLRTISICFEPHLSVDGINYLQDYKVPKKECNLKFTQPLYQKILTSTHLSGEARYYFAVVLNIVLGTSIPVILYCIMRMIDLQQSPSLFVGIIAACHPVLIEYSCDVLRETFYLLFLTITIALLLLPKVNCILRWIFIGIFSGISFSFRLEAFELLLLLPLAILHIKNTSVGKSKKLLSIAIFFIFFNITIVTVWAICGWSIDYIFAAFMHRLQRLF